MILLFNCENKNFNYANTALHKRILLYYYNIVFPICWPDPFQYLLLLILK